jgi:hypothetical protein
MSATTIPSEQAQVLPWAQYAQQLIISIHSPLNRWGAAQAFQCDPNEMQLHAHFENTGAMAQFKQQFRFVD